MYQLVSFVYPFGLDSKSSYFLQIEGNEESLKNLKDALKKNDDFKFSKRTYSDDDLKSLSRNAMEIISVSQAGDNTEIVVVKGDINIGKKEKNENEQEWLEGFLVDAKWPVWRNVSEECIPLKKFK